VRIYRAPARLKNKVEKGGTVGKGSVRGEKTDERRLGRCVKRVTRGGVRGKANRIRPEKKKAKGFFTLVRIVGQGAGWAATV